MLFCTIQQTQDTMRSQVASIQKGSLVDPCPRLQVGVNPGKPRGSSVQPRAATTAWDNWSGYMEKNRPAKASSSAVQERDFYKELAAAIKSTAQGYKPKFAVPHETAVTTFKLAHIEDFSKVNELPHDMHERLEALGILQLKSVLGVENGAALDVETISMTTTDLDAAVSVTGCAAPVGSDKHGILVFIVSETEREASWSRLDGLVLHWGATDAEGGAWGLPPQGWKASPDKVVDAGGAWQCGFEKKVVAGNQPVHVLVLTVPLKGILKSGGIVFVLKAMGGQQTRWLKDNRTKKDFFIPLSTLPTMKA